MRTLLLALACLASPAAADVKTALDSHVLPGFHRFATETAALADSAKADCTAEALRPAYQTAFDAWMGVSHLQSGPLEAEGRNLAIAFWPDTRGMVQQTVARLLADQDPAVDSAADFAEVSVAGRGLYALEGLLYDPALSGYGKGDYPCRLVTALAADLARMGRDLDADWAVHATEMEAAGTGNGSPYLTAREATQELYTELMAGLEYTKDQRLGRPMGSFDKPRPTRAEAWRSGRSLRNVTLSLAALRDLARTLAGGPIPATDAAFEAALTTAGRLDDPVFAGVSEPGKRLKIEIVQQRIAAIQAAAATEIGAALGVAQGFNSQDGD